MKISIHTYGNVVSVDHESHVVDKPLATMFPGVSAIHYDHDSGIGHIEYLPVPNHTFYGMDGLKGLSEVLAAWNHECEACEKIRADALARERARYAEEIEGNAPKAAKQIAKGHLEKYESEEAELLEVERKAREGARKADADAHEQTNRRAPVVIEDF